MKLSQIRQIIKEEVGNAQASNLLSEIYSIELEYDNVSMIYEGMVSSIISLFLEPKLRRKAEAIRNSAEYKELEQQIKVSSKSLEQLTNQLKRKVDEYEVLIKNLQRDGIDVKMGDSMDRILQKTKNHHKDILKKYRIA